MATPPQPPHRSKRRVGGVVRFIVVRVVVWGGVLVLVLLLFGDIRSVILPRPTDPEPVAEPGLPPPSGPGWPHLRGPRYDAVSGETGLLDSWPPEGPPVLWTRDLGSGYSAFTAVGGRVWTQTQNAYAQLVLCLDADTGNKIWEYRYGWPYQAAGTYPGPRATPTWHDERIYFAGPDGLVGCLTARDGRLLWSVNLIDEFDGRGFHFGYACSPLVEEGLVILPAGGEGASVVALDARDGSTVWASGDETASYSSPMPISVGDQRHVVALLENALVSTDLETGRPLWQHVFSRGYNEHAAAPLYDEPYLMIASPFRGGSAMYRIDVDQGQAEEGEPPGASATRVWFSRRMSNDVASSVLVDGYVYGFDLRDIQSKAHRPSHGKFTCMELATGEVLWATERAGHASVIAADGKLILFNDRGEVLLLRATPERYEELARAKVFGDEICWTAPALDRGRLYLRSPSRAACLYLGEPERLARGQLDAARRLAEIPESKRLDLSWLLGGEREFPADRPTARELSLWYGVSLLAGFGAAAAIAALAYLAARIAGPAAAPRFSRIVFWSAAFFCGVAASTLLNRGSDLFIFTWPTGLFVMHQVTLIAVFWSQPRQGKKYAWWAPACAGLAFLAVCLAYFHLCRTLGLAPLWAFLLGFLPSWPVAIPAAMRLRRDTHLLEDLLWAVVSFSLYYWACGAFFLWQRA
jgi:outer membrane protein assembly factor BamB